MIHQYAKWVWDAMNEAADKKSNTYIYFIQGSGGGPIKIGVTKTPMVRLSVLQTANPHPLKMLAYFPATKHREADLHAMYSKTNHHGEWFKATEDLLALAKVAERLFQLWISSWSVVMRGKDRDGTMPTDELIGAVSSAA